MLAEHVVKQCTVKVISYNMTIGTQEPYRTNVNQMHKVFYPIP
jgi:hypothetical protein